MRSFCKVEKLPREGGKAKHGWHMPDGVIQEHYDTNHVLPNHVFTMSLIGRFSGIRMATSVGCYDTEHIVDFETFYSLSLT